MADILSPNVQRVRDAIKRLGFSIEVVELEAITRTSADAAHAVGCNVEQIAKSLIFQTEITHRPMLVIASGSNRVDEKKMAELISNLSEKPMRILSVSIPVLLLGESPLWAILKNSISSSMKTFCNMKRSGLPPAVPMPSSDSPLPTLSQ